FVMGIAGAAACPMPYAVAICGFFDQRRGLALGIMMLGAGLGAMLSPQLSAYLLNAFGWRTALLLIAAIAAVPILGIIVWLRNPPHTATGETSAQGGPAQSYLRSREFYLIAGAVAGNSVAAVGIMTSIVPLAADRGISMAEAATMLSVAGAAAFAGRLIVGWLFDKLFAPYVGATVFILAAIGALLIAWGGGGLTSYIGAGLVGTCLGAEADFVSFMVSRYFSTALFSRVVGAMWVPWPWGGGIGAYLAGLSYDWTGSYVNAFIGFVALLILSAVLLLRMPPYFHAHGKAAAH
ncbi:MAG: MFS transporter, partial [Sphingobium phenoxybenzoativorans]